jgi:hypothetical protein
VDVYGPLCFWDTSSVERADGIFSPPSALRVAGEQDPDPEDDTRTLPALARFSADLYWSTNKCTSLESTFAHCAFDGRIGHLDVSRVKCMNSLFRGNSVFNQPLGQWDVSSVVYTEFMFRRAISFNQPLDAWRFTPVDFRGVRYIHGRDGRRMRHMFQDAISFNQPLGSWNLTGVTDTSGMFAGALSFNQPLENWDVSTVKSMDIMFGDTPSFDQPLTRWAPAHLEHAYSMFLHSAMHTVDALPWLKQGLAAPGRRMRGGVVADVSELLAPDSLLADESPLATDAWLDAYTEVFPRGYMDEGSLHHRNLARSHGERAFFTRP